VREYIVSVLDVDKVWSSIDFVAVPHLEVEPTMSKTASRRQPVVDRRLLGPEPRDAVAELESRGVVPLQVGLDGNQAAILGAREQATDAPSTRAYFALSY
jgi:hypothetical protein